MRDEIETTFDIDAAIDGMAPEQLDRCVAAVLGLVCDDFGYGCGECYHKGVCSEEKPVLYFSTSWAAFGRMVKYVEKDKTIYSVEEKHVDSAEGDGLTFWCRMTVWGQPDSEWCRGKTKKLAYLIALIKWALATGKITAERIKEICG